MLFRSVANQIEQHTQLAAAAWADIFNQYIERFGFHEDFVLIKEKEKEIALLRLELIYSDDRSIQTMINILTIELEQIKGRATGKTDFYESKAVLEKQLGFSIDPQRVSVAEFYAYISVINKKWL